ncbi:MAG: amino acid adenylation domain-containing protein [Actinomycetota bacterium]
MPSPSRQHSDSRTELLKLLVDQGSEGAPIAVSTRPAQLSFAQERMWISERVVSGASLGPYMNVLGLSGRLDVEVFRQAVREIFRRHEILRTSFAGKTEPVVVLHNDAVPQVPVHDLTGLPEGRREQAVQSLVDQMAARRMQVDTWPLMRIELVRLSAEEYLSIFSVHHIVFDGVSSGVVTSELSTLYRAFLLGADSPLPQPAIQYKDYAAWQRAQAVTPRIRSQIDYWKEKLAGGSPPLELPLDRPRSASGAFRCAEHQFSFSTALTRGVVELSREAGTTVFMTLMAGLLVLLNRCTGQEDITVGSPVSNRRSRVLDDVVGCVMQPLVLRFDLLGDPSFAGLLARVRETCLTAYKNQEAPFEIVMRELHPKWDRVHAPVFQVLFNVQREETMVPDFPGISLGDSRMVFPSAALDMSVNLWIGKDRAHGVVDYRADLFDTATIDWLMRCYESAIKAVTAEPDRPLSQIPITSRDQSAGAAIDSQSGVISERRQELLRLLTGAQDVLTLRPERVEGPQPCSFGQERLWFFERLSPGTCLFNQSQALLLEGPLDLGILEQSFNRIVRRHGTLRTGFSACDGRPAQVIRPAVSLKLAFHDLSHLGADRAQAESALLIDAMNAQVFDLEAPPLLCGQVHRLGPSRHILGLTVHHLISDGWSARVMRYELAANYSALISGTEADLPELAVQYADYAVWQRRWYREIVIKGQLSYWKRQLAGDIPILELPVDRPRPPGLSFARNHSFAFGLPEEAGNLLDEMNKEHAATPYMVFLSILCVWLHRCTGQVDLLVDSPVSGRSRTELEGLIGFFVNSLLLRVDLSGSPNFTEVVRRVRRTCLDAYANQDVPLDKIVAQLQLAAERRGQALSPVSFMLHEQVVPREDLGGGVAVSPLHHNFNDEFDLTVVVWQGVNGYSAEVQFNPQLFDESTIGRMASHFQQLVASFAVAPELPIQEIKMMLAQEHRELVQDFNSNRADHPQAGSFHELFERNVQAAPNRPAVIAPPASPGEAEVRMTYDELNRRANQFARYLRGKGAGPEFCVGVCMDRSVELLIAVLGILKSGAAYVAIDHTQGIDRLRYIAGDSRSELIVTHKNLMDGIDPGVPLVRLDRENGEISGRSDLNLELPIDHLQLAYLVYTSGSTGRPKAVMVPHGSLVSAFQGWNKAYDLASISSHLQMASFSFDVFTGDLVRALGSGATLVLCPREALLVAPQLLGLIHRYEIECAEFVPGVVRATMDYAARSGENFGPLKLVIVGSDLWNVGEHRRFADLLGSQARLVHGYGVAEATIDSSYFDVPPRALPDKALVPVGRPFANTRLYVLDFFLQPVPVGVSGELYVSGPGVARGYSNQPALTAQRFVPNPFSGIAGDRLYRTGDLAKHLPGGHLAFLGRLDSQIKIRGLRIEPGEIEARLSEHPSVEQAAVVAIDDGPRGQQLAAYVALPALDEQAAAKANGAADGLVSELRRYLRECLPDYMVPPFIVVLDRLPVSPNGKVNRRALPKPKPTARPQSDSGPSSEAERKVAAIWCDVLGESHVGSRDNFFDLGGHSLLLFELQSRLAATFGQEIAIVELFRLTTVEDQAGQFEGSSTDSTGVESARDRGQRQRAAMRKRHAPVSREAAS